MKAWLDKRQYKLGPLVYWNAIFLILDVVIGVRYFFIALDNQWYILWGTMMVFAGVFMFLALKRSLHNYWMRAEIKRMRAETAAIMQRVHGEWP